MKFSRQKHRGERPDLNMAAMIDVVFLLLIFFLVTAFLSDSEFRLDSNLALSGSTDAALELEPAKLEVKMSEGGDPIFILDKREYSFTDLHNRLKEYVLGNPDVQVMISGANNVEYRVMIAVKNLCRSLGIDKTAYVITDTS